MRIPCLARKSNGYFDLFSSSAEDFPQSSVYTAAGAGVFARFSDLLIYGFATSVLILHAETVAKDGTHDARRYRTPHRLPTRLARRRCPAAFVALRRPLRPANAGAIRARRGAWTGGPPGGFGRPQHP